jgi:hypothetical protein
VLPIGDRPVALIVFQFAVEGGVRASNGSERGAITAEKLDHGVDVRDTLDIDIMIGPGWPRN